MTQSGPYSHSAKTGQFSRHHIVQIGDRPLSISQVLTGAACLGTLTETLAWTAAGVEALSALPADADVISHAAVQDLVDELRYQLDLIGAEETRQWLQRHFLTLDDLHHHVLRRLALVHGLPAGTGQGETLAIPDFWKALWSDIVLSHRFMTLAMPVVCRALVHHLSEPGETAADGDDTARQDCRKRLQDMNARPGGALLGMLLDDAEIEAFIAMETACRQFLKRLATRTNLARVFNRERRSLLRLDADCVALDSPDAAREAKLCIDVDGADLIELSREVGAEHRRIQQYLGEFPREMRARLLAAVPDELVTIDTDVPDMACCLWRIRTKTEASLDDPDVRARVEEQLLREELANHLRGSVTWLTGDPPAMPDQIPTG